MKILFKKGHTTDNLGKRAYKGKYVVLYMTKHHKRARRHIAIRTDDLSYAIEYAQHIADFGKYYAGVFDGRWNLIYPLE